MPTCRECNDEVTKLVFVKVAGKARKVCEDCADRLREEGEVAEVTEKSDLVVIRFAGEDPLEDLVTRAGSEDILATIRGGEVVRTGAWKR